MSKPGTYAITSNSLTIREALELAGGLTELGSQSNLIVKQEFTFVDDIGNTVTDLETVNSANLDFPIGINSVIIASPVENVVRVEGNVYNPGLVSFISGIRLSGYIERAGGYRPDTMKKKIYIKRANGSIEKTNRIFGKKMYAGDTIVVPVDPTPPDDFDTTAFTADILSVLVNIVAILAITDNKK